MNPLAIVQRLIADTYDQLIARNIPDDQAHWISVNAVFDLIHDQLPELYTAYTRAAQGELVTYDGPDPGQIKVVTLAEPPF